MRKRTSYLSEKKKVWKEDKRLTKRVGKRRKVENEEVDTEREKKERMKGKERKEMNETKYVEGELRVYLHFLCGV